MHDGARNAARDGPAHRPMFDGGLRDGERVIADQLHKAGNATIVRGGMHPAVSRMLHMQSGCSQPHVAHAVYTARALFKMRTVPHRKR